MGASFITVSSNIPEIKELFKNLGGAPEVLDSFAEAAAFSALNKAINRVPKDEGFLADSINIEPRRDLSPKGVYSLNANADYAPYVEFGTGTKVDVPEELGSFALQFKGQIEIIGQKAQPYLYPSAVEGQQMFKDFFFKWLDKNT